MIIEIQTSDKIKEAEQILIHRRLKKHLDKEFYNYTMQFFNNGEVLSTIGEFK